MPTQEPEWEYIGNLRGESVLTNGGSFIYRDKTGVYEDEAEFLVVDDVDDEKSTYTVYRFSLDRLKLVGGVLVPLKYQSTWGLPGRQSGPFEWLPDISPKKFEEWFADSLPKIAQYMSIETDELLEALISADPRRRAFAYEAIGEYHGFENLDSYPLQLTHAETKKRYRDELKYDKRKSKIDPDGN